MLFQSSVLLRNLLCSVSYLAVFSDPSQLLQRNGLDLERNILTEAVSEVLVIPAVHQLRGHAIEQTAEYVTAGADILGAGETQ